MLLVLGVSETACVRVLLVKTLVYVLRTAARTNGQLRATDGGASGHAGQTHLRARGVPSRQFDPDLPAGRLSPTAYRTLACGWHIFMVRWCPLGGMSGSHEDLQTANMLKNHHLAKSIADAGWRAFLRILSFKAAEAGKTVVAVPPAFTSQACSDCAVLVHKGLSVRWHLCPDRGTSLHRDHNAALNILRLGRQNSGAGQSPSGANVGRWAGRSLSIRGA